jgi:endonuclease/exonuclease/phosphatase family metal-dependent hydrolase
MSFNRRRTRLYSLSLFLFVGWVATGGVSGCASHYAIAPRSTAGPAEPAWFGPVVESERSMLARWSGAVGPPLVVSHAGEATRPTSSIALVTWNVAVGGGDVEALVGDVKRAYPDSELVLLLQETYRQGAAVPTVMLANAIVPGRLGGNRPRGFRDVESIAERLQLNLYYVPSMRNGVPSLSSEDRGNAILSTLPLDSLSAIELPFERQRRVAVAATASGRDPDGEPWRIRLVSAHLDNLVSARKLWVAGGIFARARQARALVDYVKADGTAIVGGDFNTWFGFADLAFVETRRAFPDTHVTDVRPTFLNLLRLDHVFFRVPDDWTASFVRAARSYGSDHWPLIATIRIG